MDKPNNNTEETNELVKNIIDSLIEHRNVAVAYHWGEPSIMLCDVINIINNVAKTDYKRYFAYSNGVRASSCKPNGTSIHCYICSKFWANNTNKQGCLGFKVKDNENKDLNSCDKFEGMR